MIVCYYDADQTKRERKKALYLLRLYMIVCYYDADQTKRERKKALHIS